MGTQTEPETVSQLSATPASSSTMVLSDMSTVRSSPAGSDMQLHLFRPQEFSAAQCSRLKDELQQLRSENKSLQDELSFAADVPTASQAGAGRCAHGTSRLQGEYEEMKRWLIGSEEVLAKERCSIRAEALAYETEDAELRRLLKASEAQSAASTASALASADKISGLQTKLSQLGIPDAQIKEEVDVPARPLQPSLSFSPTAAETATAAAAEMEQLRWERLCQDLLEPLRQRSVELQRRCMEESCAREAAEFEVIRWRSEAEALAVAWGGRSDVALTDAGCLAMAEKTLA